MRGTIAPPCETFAPQSARPGALNFVETLGKSAFDEVHDEVHGAAKPQPNRTKFFTEGNEGNKDFVAFVSFC
jgi:hypothetical protein